ncbi:yippee-domain-containing protein [Rhizoclosmatium globosum]|uniref:Protein yippee-like n=1 Tax=Rhizoclosmatium globosum TaxID=329046 RepID=A0A1Y2CWT8_9FUNG|nr:hypothetical protein HDU99_009692 [Rhizoclosmatium hyalinum]ORY51489.1 yippee-domain-containing protein [Rhizoclosmatium globosum]|eukprot:ORY51489.1 yippee-domain-containing protein [Rhizoclosmatium globosum]
MGVLHKVYLDDADDWEKPTVGYGAGGLVGSEPADTGRLCVCVKCKTHLTTTNDLLSKQFQGSRGKAYLFNRVINITEGSPEHKQMTTGLHIVRDISCTCCNSILGWKYDKAYEEAQRYKEGRYILEVAAFKNV